MGIFTGVVVFQPAFKIFGESTVESVWITLLLEDVNVVEGIFFHPRSNNLFGRDNQLKWFAFAQSYHNWRAESKLSVFAYQLWSDYTVSPLRCIPYVVT